MSHALIDVVDRLLIDRATCGLSPEEEVQLSQALQEQPWRDAEEYELLAASLDVALWRAEDDVLPKGLGARIEADARAGLAARRVPGTPATGGDLADRPWQVMRPWLAAAALLLAALWILTPRVAVVDPLRARVDLLASASDVIRIEWAAQADPTAGGAGGDVVWSPGRREGFMRFSGLTRNDPTEFEYQLWIFDAQRDERYPVDGGVFDVTNDGEVIVPIDSRLPVSQATLFAVTVEQPGGVVVSTRDRLALIAAVP